MNSGDAIVHSSFLSPKIISHFLLMPGRFAPPLRRNSPNRGSRIPRNPVRGADPRFVVSAARRPGRPCKQGLPAFCGSAAEGDSILFCAAVKAALSISSYLFVAPNDTNQAEPRFVAIAWFCWFGEFICFSSDSILLMSRLQSTARLKTPIPAAAKIQE